jgi:hypothetical protein
MYRSERDKARSPRDSLAADADARLFTVRRCSNYGWRAPLGTEQGGRFLCPPLASLHSARVAVLAGTPRIGSTEYGRLDSVGRSQGLRIQRDSQAAPDRPGQMLQNGLERV